MTNSETIAVYDAKADDYARLVADWSDPQLPPFIAAMPAGGHVLDLGCGPGNAAAIMAAAGLRVTATDASAEMVRRAARHPGVTARQASFDQIEGENLYDGIWASFSLLHAPRAALPDHLRALHRAAQPGARLHLAMKLGDGEGPDALGRFYVYYSADALDRHLSQAGFTAIARVTGSNLGLAGQTEEWIAITAHA
jgi:SAM-dependent methyltransferase